VKKVGLITADRLDKIPEGGIKKDAWKRFWVEEPYPGTTDKEFLQAQQ